VPAAIIFLKRKKLPLLTLLDLASPYAALGQAIGRVGCFLNGCCYGRPVAWGPYFPEYHTHLHPTQIYESAGLLIVFLLLKKMAREKFYPGRLVVTYLLSAAAIRFIVQFFRYDYDPIFWGLGLFQWICVAVFLAAVLLSNFLKKINTTAP
jgi:phosphatidylglycerol:prolipoprotein diacylglycerol transferase